MKRPKRPCEHCGELFLPSRSDAKFCTRDCKNDHRTQAASGSDGEVCDPIADLHRAVDRLAEHCGPADIEDVADLVADRIARSIRLTREIRDQIARGQS